MKLSIIVPVYNEEKTVQKLLNTLVSLSIPSITIETIVVNDGSTDKTSTVLNNFKKKHKKIVVVNQKKNQGKGKAVRTGIDYASGDYIVIQDADLEYHPKQIVLLVKPVLDKKAEVVYGTRLDRMPHLNQEESKFRFLLHFFGNRFLSLITSILYGQWITDMETCYKLFPKNAASSLKLQARGFELEPEITAKLIKAGYRIYEVSITTKPRGYDEGKKLDTFRDGVKALQTLFYYRFYD